ncbi:MAG TPA: hypothetical protein VJ869_01035 [Sphaerochaeta sp.]|nr:hypothetical protein [Sphaerochaeta sp.]
MKSKAQRWLTIVRKALWVYTSVKRGNTKATESSPRNIEFTGATQPPDRT